MAAQDEDDRRDEDELDEDVSDDDEAEETSDDEDDAPDADDEDAEEDDEASDDEDEVPSDDDEASDDDAADEPSDDDGDRAADVARALGVGDDEEDEASDDDEDDDEKKALNRAERRRQRARRRRNRRQGKSDDEESPKDRNKKKREELLARRRKAADEDDEEEETAVQGLAATELVEDALARGTNAGVKWIQNNWKVLQWVITAAILVGVGSLVYVWQTNKSTTAAADAYAAGLELEYAVVISPDEDERTDEQKQRDFRKVFASDAEKQQAVLDQYAKVTSEHAGSTPETLAKMGEAGVLLDKRDWDGAVAAFDQVIGSELAGSDPGLKARALESKGFALESKGDLAAAATVYQELSGSEQLFYQLTAKFHQARVLHLQKKDPEAITLLKETREAVSKAKIDSKVKFDVTPFRWLEREVKELLMALDPSEIPVKAAGGPGQITPEMIQQMLKEQGIQGGMVPPQ